MKATSILFLVGLFALTSAAQTPAPTLPETFVTGDLTINYATRSIKGTGVVDTYKLDVNVSNSSKVYGTITQLPYLSSTMGVGGQSGHLSYDLKWDVLNPKNPAQSLNVGVLSGVVPVSDKNVYAFDAGNLITRVFAHGAAKGFDSQTKGVALGKPPTPTAGFLDSMKKTAMTFTKQVGNQTQRIVVTKYDIMEFRNHVLAAGPAQSYGESTVNGQMVYGYDRQSWYFNHLLITYWVTDPNGSSHQVQDTISGDIRWVEDADRKHNGIGEYQFDIRVNEPPPSENAVFTAPTDESAFFQQDVAAMGLSGSMKYKDTMTPDGDSCTASVIKIDLHGNKLTRHQCMVLAKLLLFSALVPFNAE